MKTLLILGATGLVGGQTLQLALAHPEVARVVAPTRRPLPATTLVGGERQGAVELDNPVVDFDALPLDARWWRADAVICALGTTIGQAGSQPAFRQVDHDYVMQAARLARDAGTPVFVLNSALGANPASRNFYLRVKGELERDLQALGFDSLSIARPSLLEGQRAESRTGEVVGVAVGRILGPLVPRRYRPVSAQRVARAMLDAALRAEPGFRVIESEALQQAG